MSGELGTLVVVVLKARNLRDKHSFYKQDVYAKITINGVTKKTAVEVKGGQHPVWDEELRFPISVDKSVKARTLQASCWSVEPRGDESVGEGELDITETLNTGEFDDWVPLKVDGAYRGDLYLEMTFYAAGPPPALTRRPTKLKPAERLQRPEKAYAYAPVVGAASPPREHSSLPTTQSSLANGHRNAASRSVSPHYKKDALPPLPEESVPTPQNVPAILRPGKSPSPVRGPGVAQQPLPLQNRSRTSSLTPPQGHSPPQSLVPSLPQATQAHLPGHGGIGVGTAGSCDLPPSLQHGKPPRPQSQYYDGHQRNQSLPYNAYPPNSNPTPIPTPGPVPTPYDHVPAPYDPTPTPYDPTPYSYNNHTSEPAPTFSFPTPDASIYNPAPGSSPPYTPPASIPSYRPPPSIPTYGPPPASSYSYPHQVAPYPPYSPVPPPVQQPPSRPYSYYAPPPVHGSDPDLPDPFKLARYQTPLPLPDEPNGSHVPKHKSSHKSSQSTSSSHEPDTAKESKIKKAEEDRALALAVEREEEERKRKLREQEELDLEMARKLDMELNIG